MAEHRKMDLSRAVRIGEWSRLKYLERIGVGNVIWARNESLSEDEMDYLMETRSKECDLTDEQWKLLEEEGKFLNFETRQFEFDSTIQTSLSDSQIAQAAEWSAATDDEHAIGFGLWAYAATVGGLIEPEVSMYYFRLTLDLLGFIQADESSMYAEKKLETFRSDLGKKTVSHRLDQKLKQGWLNHCRKIKQSGVKISTLGDLTNIDGYDPLLLRVAPRTLKMWAREVGIEFKPGRPKE